MIFDDTLGAPGIAPGDGTYDYAIRPERGEARGGNLFFSFSEFWIHGGQEAGLLGGGFDNVVLRVPNEAAHIGGTLTSTIPDANVFLLAPRGIHFGEGAVVDVSGSLALSTADSLVLEDGDFPSHGPVPWRMEDSRLCCNGAPIALRFEGVADSDGISQILLPEPENPDAQDGFSFDILPAADLWVAAGQVIIERSRLESRDGGTIYIAATGRAPATVPLAADLDPAWLENVGEEAQVRIAGGTLNAAGPGLNQARGRVVLRGGELVVTDESTIVAGGDYPRGTLELRAAHSLEVSGSSRLIALNPSLEETPGIYLNAPQVRIKGLGDTQTLLRSRKSAPIAIVAESSLDISASEVGGRGGKISIQAGRLDLSNKAKIRSLGDGLIEIQVEGSLDARDEATILSQPDEPSKAGDILIMAEQLHLESGAQIRSFSDSNANAGDIYVTVTNAASISGAVAVQGELVSSAILTRAGETNRDPRLEGSAGNIELDVGSLEVTGGGLVSSRGFESRDAGSITIKADGDVSVAGAFDARASLISAQNRNGEPGNILVAARSVSIRDGAALSAGVEGSAPPGGSIEVKARQNFLLADASVTADSLASVVGGDIDIAAGGWIVLQNGRIETNVLNGAGRGGNIRIGIASNDIPAPRLAVLNASSVTAIAEAGAGGNIDLHADTLLLSTDSVLDASSELGVDGSLEVAAPVVQVAGRLDPLPASFLDVSALLQAHCAQRAAEGGSSFVIEEGPPPPPSPRGYLPSPPRLPSSAQTQGSEAMPSVSWQLTHFDAGCGRDPQLARAP